jgi:hypothetical protein
MRFNPKKGSDWSDWSNQSRTPPTKVPTGGGAAAAPPEAGVKCEGVSVGVEK